MVTIDGNSLTIEQVIRVARFCEEVKISNDAIDNINKSNVRLNEILNIAKPVYGINTGYGIFSNEKLSLKESEQLNRNLILSHAIGVGEYFPEEIVRAAMLIRANTLAKGYSGVREIIVNTLIEMLNKQVTPCVRSQGSLGSSGDLCLLAQVCLVLTTDKDDLDSESGKAILNGKIFTGKKAMRLAGIDRIVCQPKEGLALINGATFTAAICVLAIYDANKYWHIANLTLALSMEALRARTDILDARIHQLRGMDGQIITANEVLSFLNESTFINTNDKVQDAYSIRCAPQVHGAVYDSIQHARGIITKEINAVTDNPIILDDKTVISGGNFHGEPLGIVLDLLNIATSELGAISERRTACLLDSSTNNGLPTMLVDPKGKSGLQSGLMILQYTAASLVLENKLLASPASIHSLPTSANQEDHNANCTTAARHALEIIINNSNIFAVEAICAFHAIQILMNQKITLVLSNETNKLFTKIHDAIGYDHEDHIYSTDIESVRAIFTKLFETR